VVFRGAIVAAVTPDRLRGRVMAADYVVGAGGGQLGNLEAGAVAAVTSPAISALAGGLATVAAALAIALALPAFTRYRSDAARQRAHPEEGPLARSAGRDTGPAGQARAGVTGNSPR
jgi:hypothetical protein